MICRILLLITLTSCVCGTFVVNVTQSSYQAEENHNVTLEWTFTTKQETTLTFIIICCQLVTASKIFTLFHLHEGVEVPESQDEQFQGRVQFDKDVLREGRIRLHVSRLRTDDSGLYLCEVNTNYGVGYGETRLNVTAMTHQPEPEPDPEPERPDTGSWRRIVLYCGLTASVLVFVFLFTLLIKKVSLRSSFCPQKSYSSADETV